MASSRLGPGRVQVVTVVDQDVYDAIQQIAFDSELSKMRVMEILLETALDQVNFMSFLGLTQRRLTMLRKGLVKAGMLDEEGNFHIPVRKRVKAKT